MDTPLAGYADKIAAIDAEPEVTKTVIGNRTYYVGLIQGSEEWHAARCGLLTASEMHLIVTPTFKAASNDKERGHLYELLAQRMTQYVEPSYISDTMLRGHEDEIEAVTLYGKHYAKVSTDIGFMTNSEWGFTIGYSPDGLIGADGQVECKSRNQKYQMRTILEYMPDKIDPDFVIQAQTGLMVSGRNWCDLCSYCGGLFMATARVYPDETIQAAILDAAAGFEKRMKEKASKYAATINSGARLIPTKRKVIQEMF